MKHLTTFLLILFSFSFTTAQSFSRNGQSFCYKEMLGEGLTSRVTLMDGGSATISFLNESGRLVRQGDARWSGTNDGPGGDMPVITVTLSTGARIRFNVVVKQYSSRITELIDSRDRIYSSCENMTAGELEDSYKKSTPAKSTPAKKSTTQTKPTKGTSKN